MTSDGDIVEGDGEEDENHVYIRPGLLLLSGGCSWYIELVGSATFGRVQYQQLDPFIRQIDPVELQKLHTGEKHLKECPESQGFGDWKSALRESYATIVAGAHASPQLLRHQNRSEKDDGKQPD